MGGGPAPTLTEPVEPVPAGDSIAGPDAPMFYFAVPAHIVELIPASASDACKVHLRSVGVSYILAGDEEHDMTGAVEKIGEIFSVGELILGGGTLN